MSRCPVLWLLPVAVALVVSRASFLSAGDPPDGRTGLVLDSLWRRTAVGVHPDEEFGGNRADQIKKWIGALYQSAELDAHSRSRPVIPPGVPTVQDNLVIYANGRGVAVRTLVPGTAFGERFQAGELFWESEGDNGLAQMAESKDGRALLEQWLKGGVEPALARRVLHRTLCHAVCVRKGVVLFVDDAGLLPPPPESEQHTGVNVLSTTIRRTLVRDMDLQSGKIVRKFGNWGVREDKNTDFIILGLPLADGAERTVAYEYADTVRLLKLDLTKYIPAHWAGGSDRGLAAGRKWEVELVKPPTRIADDPHRRVHAIHLVDAAGLVISPTNLGRVLAVDAHFGQVRWVHEYAPLDAKRFPTFAPEWVVVPPVVVGDRYVYAPADFPELLCLTVADGKKVWSVKKGDGLYPAVAGEQVLVIGEKTIRGLSLKDGSEQWTADLPGLPCGRGAVLGDTYLVPVSEPKTWKGLIAVVDLKAGKVAEVLRPEKDEPIGNLVVHGDFLISQTLTEIAVFPIKNK